MNEFRNFSPLCRFIATLNFRVPRDQLFFNFSDIMSMLYSMKQLASFEIDFARFEY